MLTAVVLASTGRRNVRSRYATSCHAGPRSYEIEIEMKIGFGLDIGLRLGCELAPCVTVAHAKVVSGVSLLMPRPEIADTV